MMQMECIDIAHISGYNYTYECTDRTHDDIFKTILDIQFESEFIAQYSGTEAFGECLITKHKAMVFFHRLVMCYDAGS